MANLGLEAAARLNRKALFGGGGTRSGPLSTTWDISGNGKLRCLTPCKTELRFNQPLDDYIVGLAPDRTPQYIDLSTRCRKCANCLRLRGIHWSTRMTLECELAARTWFGTITLAPAYHDLIMWRAIRRNGFGGAGWDRLSNDERFAERHKEISRELTKAVKRLRQYSRGPLRLVIVCEAHQSGLPHYHALVHETRLGAGVHERELRRAFPMGFSQWKLVEHGGKAAGYVSKYLKKSLLARVRASSDYGSLDRVATDAPWKSDPSNALNVPSQTKSDVPQQAVTTPPNGGRVMLIRL